MRAVAELSVDVGTAPACRALGVPRSTVYRRRRRARRDRECGPRRTPARRIDDSQRHRILEVLNGERFGDKAPAEVYATLLDEQSYLCSERTMYRILGEHGAVRERRDQLCHPQYRRPELLATRANEVWSWDITKLRTERKWTYFYLYVILDIFSRYVVGWMVAHAESTELARRLIGETCEKQGIREGELTVHADRGASMMSKGVAQLLADLGVAKSHSRPHVSNDNPYSESQFKTLKYHPEFPDRFGGIEDTLSFGRRFFPWYNWEHRHSGIGMMTPGAVHYGHAGEIVERRRRVLEAAYREHPERFVRGVPTPPELPTAVWINRPERLSIDDIVAITSENEAHKRLGIDDRGAGRGVGGPEFASATWIVPPSTSADAGRLHTKFETHVSQSR